MPQRREVGRRRLDGLDVALVAVGGALGAGARDAVEQVLPAPAAGLPAGTLVVNLVGAFVLGALVGGLARLGSDDGWRRRVRLLVGAGGCGGLTTYSTLAVETLQLLRHGHVVDAAAYQVVSLCGGLLAAASGLAVTGALARDGARSLARGLR